MIVIIEILGALVFAGILVLGVKSAVAWVRRRNNEAPTNE